MDKLASNILEPLNNSGFQTDNKEIRKKISAPLERIEKEAEIKKACLNRTIPGFAIKEYLDAKAKASIDQTGLSKSKTKQPTVILSDLKHPEFYNQLYTWRKIKANELNTTISRIMQQKTLLNIAQAIPATVVELKAIKGMGGTKMKQFGKELMEMLFSYRKEKGLELPIGAEKEIAKAGLDTKHLSFELFKTGKNISEIAHERSLARSTIVGHLGFFVGTGELEIEKLVESDRIAAITNFFTNHKNATTTDARNNLGNDYSYTEIKLVLQHIESK